MQNIPSELYKKVVRMSDEVKRDLFRKGIVVPTKNKDGSISVGFCKIVRDKQGYYSILTRNDVLVEGINLPQTAAVVANGIALGKHKDNKLIESDKHYGYALFEEALHKRAVEKSNKKSLEYFDLMMTKCLIAQAKKERYKQEVVKSFEKLIKLV